MHLKFSFKAENYRELRVALISGKVLFSFWFFLFLPIGRNCQKPINYNYQSETITVSCIQIDPIYIFFFNKAQLTVELHPNVFWEVRILLVKRVQSPISSEYCFLHTNWSDFAQRSHALPFLLKRKRWTRKENKFVKKNKLVLRMKMIVQNFIGRFRSNVLSVVRKLLIKGENHSFCL